MRWADPRPALEVDQIREPYTSGHRILKHPTQKPLALARRLLRSRIKGAGGRVLVPFAGSGSECVATWASRSTRTT